MSRLHPDTIDTARKNICLVIEDLGVTLMRLREMDGSDIPFSAAEEACEEMELWLENAEKTLCETGLIIGAGRVSL
jgi:hypothetical protein